MPAVSLDRVPLPSIRLYAIASLAAFVATLVYVYNGTNESIEDQTPPSLEDSPLFHSDEGEARDSLVLYFFTMIGLDLDSMLGDYTKIFWTVLLTELWCILVVVNMVYCVAAVIARCVQLVFFGNLRIVEIQQMKDKFWNFAFYKFIFIFGVLNVQTLEEIFLWCTWFSMLGCLHLMTQLCKDRFDYLSSCPTSTPWVHARILAVLGELLISGMFLLSLSFTLGLTVTSAHIFFFLAAEVVILLFKTVHVIIKSSIHLWDMTHEGTWENRAAYVYHTDLVCELLVLLIEFIHHFHMLFWSNIFLSMASLVICMQLRFIFHEFKRRLKRHKNYLRVVNTMQARFPMATTSELEANSDRCAICWEKMEAARKLPCGHYFHNSCLLSWLEQDTTCPTCRTALGNTTPAPAPTGTNPPEPQPAPNQPARPAPSVNHFFHFDGSRYVSWFPSFSVEVMTHAHGQMNRQRVLSLNSQLDNLARQIRDIFPQVPFEVIVDDLRHTHSMDATIDNIVEGRIHIPEASNTPSVGEPVFHPQSTSLGGEPLLYDPPSTSGSQEVAGGVAEGGAVGGEVRRGSDWDQLQDLVQQVDAREDEGRRRDVEQTSAQPSASECSAAATEFSKVSSERESSLQQRKRELIERAKSNYFQRHAEHEETDTSLYRTTETPSPNTPSSDPSAYRRHRSELN